MIKLIAGLNGEGKTVLLKELLNKCTSTGNKPVTNLKNIEYDEFNQERIDLITSDDACENIFNYTDIQFTLDGLTAVQGTKFSKGFMELLNLLCRDGNILILDEPDSGLNMGEIMVLANVLSLLNRTYDVIFMITHEQLLFPLENEAYWVEDYIPRKISRGELFKHVGKI